jgi:predicted Zn finger-like uncharacterized protein
MRLICPSCGAQYEVDESVIPDGGRDVQCSNCGHAWFQRSARQLGDEAEEAALAPAEAEPPAPAAAAPAAAEVAPEPSAAWAEHDEEPEEPAKQAPEEMPVPERARRTLDDAVRNVLREEAERETQARVAEGGPIETQPDLGLAAAIGGAAASTGGRAGEAPRDRVAKVGGDALDYDEDALVSRAARRELLPDIEEINSTLRATSERGGEAAAFDAPETLARRRSGFRMGFSTALLAAAVLLGVYVLAPTLARMLPALEPSLSLYVKGIDAGRQWLDGRMQSLTQSLQGGATD